MSGRVALSGEAVDAAARSVRGRMTCPNLRSRDPAHPWCGDFWAEFWQSLEGRWQIVRGEWTPPESAEEWVKERHRERHPDRYEGGQQTLSGFGDSR
jgi:hypothetical protein